MRRPVDKRMIVCAMLVILGAAMSARARAGAAMTYDEARAALAQASHAQRAGEAAVSRSTSQARAADSLGHPEVGVSLIQVWGVKTDTLQSPFGPLDIHQNLQGPRSSINMTWPIYTGGRIRAQQRALDAGIVLAGAELERLEQGLDAQLAEVYFGVALAADVERTRRSVLEQADRQLDRAKRFEAKGVVATVERLNTQVARDEAAREHVRADRDLEIARMRLQRLLVSDTAVEPATPLFVVTGAMQPLSQWLSSAEASNPLLKGLAARRTQAEQGVVAAEGRWKPEVYAFGTYNTIRHYQTLIEPNWIAGVGVSFPLYARTDRSEEVSAARAALRQVESLEGEARNEILTTVEAAYRKVEQAREQFHLLESSLAGARENLRLRERGFEEGQATSLDVNEARNALARAQTQRAATAYEFVVALARLLEASGQPRPLGPFIRRAEVTLTP